MTSQKYVFLRVRAEDWETLRETLEADTQSIAFDKELRVKIHFALSRVKEIAEVDTCPLCARIREDAKHKCPPPLGPGEDTGTEGGRAHADS